MIVCVCVRIVRVNGKTVGEVDRCSELFRSQERERESKEFCLLSSPGRTFPASVTRGANSETRLVDSIQPGVTVLVVSDKVHRQDIKLRVCFTQHSQKETRLLLIRPSSRGALIHPSPSVPVSGTVLPVGVFLPGVRKGRVEFEEDEKFICSDIASCASVIY